MSSIIGKLDALKRNPKNESSKIIAKVLINSWSNGIFFQQKELSKKCFVSESTITLFCKKIGFSGYREFNERFKVEYEKYIGSRKENQNLSFDFQTLKQLSENLKDIKNSQDFILGIRKLAFDKKIIHVFPSYQSQESAYFLRDLLEDNEILIKVYNFSKTMNLNMNNFVVKDEEPILFIFTGSDTWTLYDLYNILNSNKNVFAITSQGQSDRLIDSTNKFVLKSYNKYSSTFYRATILQLLFITIFE